MFLQAPEPLLANWGAGSIRTHAQDINMMSMLNAKERTAMEFAKFGWVLSISMSCERPRAMRFDEQVRRWIEIR